MPESIRMRARKVGFNSPMPEWLNGPLIPWVESVMRSNVPAFDELVDDRRLQQAVEDLTSSRRWNWTSVGRIWPYLNLKWMLARA